MEKNLENYRRVYQKSELRETNLEKDPFVLFQKWFDEVEASKGIDEANAMTVSSIGLDGYPKNRVVLLKKFSNEGFVFYTNYNSEKGKAIQHHPKVCLSFFWPVTERQVIIKGVAEKVSSGLSDQYFDSRPEGSKLGALVSPQSEPIPNREYLEEKLKMLEREYQDQPIKRPEYWGGYIVRPVSMEFWQGRPNRLHDRFRYEQQEDLTWQVNRLAP